MTLPKPVMDEIVRLVDDLVGGRFDQLQSDGRAGRLTAHEFAREIEEYGRTLVSLPDQAFELVDVYPLREQRFAWAIDVPLWTREEGRSDLTLSVTARQRGPEQVEIEVDDLHVL